MNFIIPKRFLNGSSLLKRGQYFSNSKINEFNSYFSTKTTTTTTVEKIPDRSPTNAPNGGIGEKLPSFELTKTAEDLISEIPPIEVNNRVAACDGGRGPLGHPRVFIKLDKIGIAEMCEYCGLRYIRK